MRKPDFIIGGAVKSPHTLLRPYTHAVAPPRGTAWRAPAELSRPVIFS
jgi:hypothetical protein